MLILSGVRSSRKSKLSLIIFSLMWLEIWKRDLVFVLNYGRIKNFGFFLPTESRAATYKMILKDVNSWN